MTDEKSIEERLDTLRNEYDSREHVTALEADLFELATAQDAELRQLRTSLDTAEAKLEAAETLAKMLVEGELGELVGRLKKLPIRGDK